jgi:hypothetical protein
MFLHLLQRRKSEAGVCRVHDHYACRDVQRLAAPLRSRDVGCSGQDALAHECIWCSLRRFCCSHSSPELELPWRTLRRYRLPCGGSVCVDRVVLSLRERRCALEPRKTRSPRERRADLITRSVMTTLTDPLACPAPSRRRTKRNTLRKRVRFRHQADDYGTSPSLPSSRGFPP